MASIQSISLLHAAACGDSVSVSALLADGVNPNVQDEMGWSPLMRAAHGGYETIVEQLLTSKSPASVRTSNKHGKTALHYACMNGNLKIVQLLLARAADPGKPDKAGRTPIDEAQDGDHLSVLNMILTLRADVTVPAKPSPPEVTPTRECVITVQWAPLENRHVKSGAGKVQSYRVQYSRMRDGALGKWTLHPTQPKEAWVELSDLQPGAMYCVRVAGVNGFGRGSYSLPSKPVSPLVSSPSPPTVIIPPLSSSPPPTELSPTATPAGVTRAAVPSPSNRSSSLMSASANVLTPTSMSSPAGGSRSTTGRSLPRRQSGVRLRSLYQDGVTSAALESDSSSTNGIYWGAGGGVREDRLLAAVAASLAPMPAPITTASQSVDSMDELWSRGLMRNTASSVSAMGSPIRPITSLGVPRSQSSRTMGIGGGQRSSSGDSIDMHLPAVRATPVRVLSELALGDSLDELDLSAAMEASLLTHHTGSGSGSSPLVRPGSSRGGKPPIVSSEVNRLKGEPDAIKDLTADELSALEDTLERSLKRVREAKAKRLLEALGEQKDRQCCIVCQDAPKTVLLLPCRHLCLCKACYTRIRADRNVVCPVCRSSVSDCLDVYH